MKQNLGSIAYWLEDLMHQPVGDPTCYDEAEHYKYTGNNCKNNPLRLSAKEAITEAFMISKDAAANGKWSVQFSIG